VAGFEILRRICEEEPRRPSDCAQTQDRSFYRKLSGDLEAVVLKALQKKPGDRYKSVEHFIDDVESFLERRPVLARRQSWWYQTRRLASRHPSATVSVSIAATVGILALAGILSSDRAAKQERDYAFRQRELAASTARTMIDETASSLGTMSAPIEHRLELLNRIVAVFDELDSTSRSGSDPAKSALEIRAEAQTQTILANALEELGDLQAATQRAQSAEVLTRNLVKIAVTDPDDQLLLTKALLTRYGIAWKLGTAKTMDATLAEAIATLRGLEKGADLTPNSRHQLEILVCNALALKVRAYDSLVDPQESLRLLTEAVNYGEPAYLTHRLEPEAVDCYAGSLETLGAFYKSWGRIALMQETVRRALAIRRKAADEAPDDIALQRLADAYRVELTLGPWASRLSARNRCNRFEASKPVRANRAECNAPPNGWENTRPLFTSHHSPL